MITQCISNEYVTHKLSTLIYVDSEYGCDTSKKWPQRVNVALVKPQVNAYSVSEVYVLVLESEPIL